MAAAAKQEYAGPHWTSSNLTFSRKYMSIEYQETMICAATKAASYAGGHTGCHRLPEGMRRGRSRNMPTAKIVGKAGCTVRSGHLATFSSCDHVHRRRPRLLLSHSPQSSMHETPSHLWNYHLWTSFFPEVLFFNFSFELCYFEVKVAYPSCSLSIAGSTLRERPVGASAQYVFHNPGTRRGRGSSDRAESESK